MHLEMAYEPMPTLGFVFPFSVVKPFVAQKQLSKLLLADFSFFGMYCYILFSKFTARWNCFTFDEVACQISAQQATSQNSMTYQLSPHPCM